MDGKASRGRKKETCGLAKNSDASGSKKEMATAEAPASKQAVEVCGEIKVASKACVNGSPHLDIGKGEGLNGSASVVGPSEVAPEVPRQSKTDNEIHECVEQTGHHRNTGTESINSTDDDRVGYLEELTPEQQRILWEKRELEQLLAQTKQLEKKAATCFHRTDEKKSMESEKQSIACKQSELSLKEPLSARKELNKQTTTVVPHEPNAPLSAQAEPGGLLNHDDAEFSALSESDAPFSLRCNIPLLEGNAELLHKKVELEVLLQTAKVLLEQTALPELNDNSGEGFSFADDNYAVSFSSPEKSGNKLDVGTTNVENDDDDDYEESENRSTVETLYEKADEITRKAKLFADMLHEDKDLGHKETQSDTENSKLFSENTDDLPSECLVQKKNQKEEDKASQAEKKASEVDREVQEETNEVDDEAETPEQRQELQRLLQQVRQLLATLNGPQTETGSKENDDESSKENEELSRTTEKKAVEGELASNLDQKEHRESIKPLEVKAAENELPPGVKKEGIEIDKHLQDPGVVELQHEALTNSAADRMQPGASEAVETVDKNSWAEVQTTLLCEKNELSLLLMKTQLLQQKAEMIMSHTHVPTTAKSDLGENSSAPLPAAAKLTPQETTEMMQTAELTSDITKPDLETADSSSKKLEQTLDTAEPSSEITKQELNTTQVSSSSVESIAEKIEPHLDETQMSSETMKEVLETTPLSSETTQETTEVSSEKIKPELDVTKIGSEVTDPNTNEKSSGLNLQASDKISLPSEIEVTSQKTSVENLNTMAENSFKTETIPQENKLAEENLQITECTKYIDESNDQNLSKLRIEATLKTDDAKPTESSSNNEAANEDTQSSHEDEDEESSDEDEDQSFDAKEELKLLLQRARLMIERSKIHVSERKPEMNHPAESGKESNNHDESHTSEMVAGKPVVLSAQQNEGSYPKKQILNSEATNKTDTQIQQTDDAEVKTTLSQDAQLELLLAQTTLLKIKADELLNNFNASELKSGLRSPNSELSNENVVQLEQRSKVHHQINVSETALDQQSKNAQLPNAGFKKLASDLDSFAALPSAQREDEEDKDATEQPKRPVELNLDLRTVAPNIDSRTEVLEKEIQSSSALPLNEDSQLELEEIEESQLEISENDKSQFEIEDEYLSDNSQLSDMNMYYEDAEYSQDEEEHLPEETNAVSNEACFPQSQQQTEAPVKKETYNEKRELELLLEITQLLLEKATLPLELIETISDENNSQALTESASEAVETIAQADQIGEELNLSLDDTMPALETKQMSLQTTETVKESTEISVEKTGNIVETTEVPSQKTETNTETRGPSFEKTETVTETRGPTFDKTETITETTETSSDKTETITETTSETSKPLEGATKMLSDLTSQTQQNASRTAETIQAELLNDPTSLYFSQKLQQLQSQVTSFLQSKLRSTAENSSTHENNSSTHENNSSTHENNSSTHENNSSTHENNSSTHENNSAENSSIHENNSSQNDAGEVREEKNSTSTTDEPEVSHHPDHSTSKEITKNTSNEQGSEFQAEATAGLPVSQTEAGKAEPLDSKPLKGWTPMTSYTLLLKLQNEMARMQLQLSHLQDAMRTTNSVIQQIMEEAFSEM